NLPPEQSFQGMSLMNIMDPGSRNPDGAHVLHPPEEKPAFSINREGRMVRFHGWKYIEIDDELGTEELYDLMNDPGETENLVLADTEKAAELRALLRSWNSSVPVVRSESYELDAESMRSAGTWLCGLVFVGKGTPAGATELKSWRTKRAPKCPSLTKEEKDGESVGSLRADGQ
ncbi:MAG: hypothetical protein U9Q95_00465, partial [Candidatus Eisenbacteria bacterium]|nr:hypothetical protein [Candidatus Eisenbacteria bacterium]